MLNIFFQLHGRRGDDVHGAYIHHRNIESSGIYRIVQSGRNNMGRVPVLQARFPGTGARVPTLA